MPTSIPIIIMFCIIGVYEVNHSIIDVWIMLIMGVVGYLLRKFDFDPAPLVLGLVIAPIFELSLRQSLVMSGGDYMIFLDPAVRRGAVCDLGAAARRSSIWSAIQQRKDWRARLAEAETGGEPLSRAANRTLDRLAGCRRDASQRGAGQARHAPSRQRHEAVADIDVDMVHAADRSWCRRSDGWRSASARSRPCGHAAR